MKIIITVACRIDGVQVLPDMIRPIEVRDSLARHLIAECKALPAPEQEFGPAPARGKKDKGGSNG